MADGVRIQPQAIRLRADRITSPANRMFILRDHARPIPPHPQNPVCRHCGRPHDCKTYHFQLDADGTIIVSTTIWERLQTMPDHGGFERVNTVSKPPTQNLALT